MMLAKHRIVLLGAESVGKSSIMQQFINEVFTDNLKETVADCYQHIIKLPNGLYRHIEILDAGSFNQFPVMRDLSIQLGHAFAVVYAVDDYDSFNAAIDMCTHIYQIKGTRNVQIVLVGNKMDASGSERLISTECGMNLASRFLKCAFLETSAMLNLNMLCLFQTLLPVEYHIASNAANQTESKQTDTKKHDAFLTKTLTKQFKEHPSVGLRGKCIRGKLKKSMIYGQIKRI